MPKLGGGEPRWWGEDGGGVWNKAEVGPHWLSSGSTSHQPPGPPRPSPHSRHGSARQPKLLLWILGWAPVGWGSRAKRGFYAGLKK